MAFCEASPVIDTGRAGSGYVSLHAFKRSFLAWLNDFSRLILFSDQNDLNDFFGGSFDVAAV